MRLYIVRHGESVGSVGPNLQYPEESLTEIGFKEAELLASQFDQIPLDAVLSSPFFRTQQTAEAIAKRKSLPVAVHQHFRGMQRPSEQMPLPKEHPRVYEIDQLVKSNFHDPSWRYGDGETFDDIKARVLHGLTLLEELPYDHVALVTHSVIMRYLLGCMIFGEDLTSKVMESVLASFRMPTPGMITAKFQKNPTSKDVWSAQSKTGWVVEMGFDLVP